MKRISIFLALAALLLTASAQTGPIFLFEKFTNARIHFKNRSVTVSSMNYDAAGGKMYFMQQEDFMELTNAAAIDTIAWGNRKFIPHGRRFHEVFRLDQSGAVIYVDWLLKDVHLGSKGAMGLPTQGKVENLKLGDFTGEAPGFDGYTTQGTYDKDVWKRKNDNTYYLNCDGKTRKIKNLKQLCQAFPDLATELRHYAHHEKLDMGQVPDALKLLDFCLSNSQR